MKYSRVHLEAAGYELAPNVITSAALERRLAPLYEKLHFQSGQLEALTGIRERRWWNTGTMNAESAAKAGRKALERAALSASDLGVIIYAGVCRDHIEPATACAVASYLDLPTGAEVYDLSNACLGVLNAMLIIADRIELGHIRAGIVVSCESAREITNSMIEHMLAEPSMEVFGTSMATLTGGSGAVAVILSDGSFAADRPRLLGGVTRAAAEHHAICRWEFAQPNGAHGAQYMETHGAEVMKHGVELGIETWKSFRRELGWSPERVDRVICHQVGTQHRDGILKAFEIDVAKDYSTFEHLGNMGTVSLPLTAAMADERGIFSPGDRVGFLGIGSGLNCLMLGWQW